MFEVHYTPNGSPHTDISRIGLCFTDPSKVKYEVKTTAAVGRKLKIPPGAYRSHSRGNHGGKVAGGIVTKRITAYASARQGVPI